MCWLIPYISCYDLLKSLQTMHTDQAGGLAFNWKSRLCTQSPKELTPSVALFIALQLLVNSTVSSYHQSISYKRQTAQWFLCIVACKRAHSIVLNKYFFVSKRCQSIILKRPELNQAKQKPNTKEKQVVFVC